MKLQLHWQILIAVVLAVFAGLLTTPDGFMHQAYDFVGKLFLNALKMLVVPLIVSSIICAVMGIGGRDFGRVGLKTALFYLLTGVLAVSVGIGMTNLIGPGVTAEGTGQELFELDKSEVEQRLDAVSGRGIGDLVAIFQRMVPPNIIAAAAEGQMLGLIFFSLLFGFFITRLSEERLPVLRTFWQATLDVMMSITHLIMRFAPYGVFALIAGVTTATGFTAFVPVLKFFLAVLLAIAVHALVVLPLLLAVIGRVNPLRHYRAMAPAMLTAFSTASSVATLPVTMDCVRDRAGVSERTAGFVLPLGATINMDGTALYECAAVLFIAQVYGVELGFAAQFLIATTALLTSIGVAGIPSASLVAITVILGAVGLPLEGIGLLLVTDRVLDMLRTATNVFGDSCGAVVIARSEGEHGVLAEPRA